MAAFEDVERLFFEMNLLVWREVARQFRGCIIRDGDSFLRHCFGNVCGAWRAFDAVRRKGCEFGIVFVW